MSEAVIRAAVLVDALEMADCVREAYEGYVARMGGLVPGPMLADYEAEIREHGAYVMELDGAVAGILVLKAGSDFLLDNVAVRPRFQRRGLGRGLIAFAEAEARRQGYEAMTLYTHVTMTENIVLYTSLGFEEVERAWAGPYERVFMRKALV